MLGFAWISNKMKNIQNVSQYLQQFHCFVLNLRPHVSTFASLKVANATLILLKDYNVHYISWGNKELITRCKKIRKRQTTA